MTSALKLGRIWASAPLSPNIDPGVDKYRLGWVPEIPVYQVLNYLMNRYDTNIVALAERGMFEWGSDITYNLGSLVWDEVDSSIYISKVASPVTTTRPGLNLTQWDKSSIQISRAQYDVAVANWNNHIANTSNPHALTVDILDTYSKAVIDSKFAAATAAMNAHITNHANPHEVTAAQVSAVPITGGDYTGLVRHLFAATGIGEASLAATLLADATGAFITLGTSKLGLDNSFNPVFVDSSGVKTNLLLDSNYIAARELIEATYVPPTPDCEVHFRNNLTLGYGSGVVTFTGPAGSRGYLDKSGTAQTAALNVARYTAKGLYTYSVDSEVLTVPSELNLLNADNYSLCVNFQSTATVTANHYIYRHNAGSVATGVMLIAGFYVFLSVVGGVTTQYPIAAVDHTIANKVVVVSDTTLNKTFVYLNGALKVTVNNKQDPVLGAIYFSTADASFGAKYLNSFKTWLAALTAQQVSNL
jgi:hypothetical protein